VTSNPEAFAQRIQADARLWSGVIKQAGIKGE